MEDHLTTALGCSAIEAASGVTELVDENMANAARVHSVENGRDIEHFTMIAFGGGAPLHACRLCEKLGIREVIVPPGAGVGSAIGFLKAPISYEATRGFFQKMSHFDPDRVNRMLKALEDEATAFVKHGAGKAETTQHLTAFMRYSGQGWEIPVDLPFKTFTHSDQQTILSAFESAYRQLFGRTIDGLEVEITNWSVVVSTRRAETQRAAPPTATWERPATRNRTFYDARLRQMVDAQEVERHTMAPGQTVAGPAIITESETSTIITSAFYAVAQNDGSLRLTRKETAT